jgi:hypothetical protein
LWRLPRTASVIEGMADVRTAWTQAGEQLSGLGSKLKLHYEAQRTDETGEQARAQDDVKDAVKKLGEAVQDAVDAMGAAARDQAVKDDVKQVGRTLKDALGVTFAEISDELGKAFGKGQQGASGETTPGTTTDPVYDDPTAGPTTGSAGSTGTTGATGSAEPGAPTPPPTPSPPAPPREPGDPTP